ncbi:MAG: hypothetical protein ACREYF_28070 [Gammaproteobacteria bacterium]
MTKLGLPGITAGCWLLAANLANGETADRDALMEAITNNVRAVCQSPSDQGRHWSVKAKGDGGTTIGLRHIANLNVKGEAEFSKEEWQGVQQVLKKQQLDDNKDYRACARELTPTFLEKFVPGSEISGVTQPRPSEGNRSPNQIIIGKGANIGDVKGGNITINNQ